MFASVYRYTIQWGDCDPAGIVFYPRFSAIFDEATAYLLEVASGMTRSELIRHYGILGWPMVSAATEFRATATFDDKIAVHTSVQRLGTSSMIFAHELRRGEIVCVSATETRVWSAHGTGGKPLPDSLRARLSERNPKGAL
jgi:4-hydroxybenzoyl-CoA thioesterase